MIRLGIWLRQRHPQLCNADNLHRIAISNLEDEEDSFKRWWHNKYKIPSKKFDDYTPEELFIEHLEDFYASNPKAIDEFLKRSIEVEEWDGELPADVERDIQRRLAKIHARKPVDLKKYQSDDDKDLTEADMELIISKIGRDLPGSRLAAKNARFQPPAPGQVLGGGAEPMTGEFEETFGG